MGKKVSDRADYNPIVIEHLEPCEYDIYEKFAIKVAEETDKFIFEAIEPYCEHVSQMKISKATLENALKEYFTNHPEERVRE